MIRKLYELILLRKIRRGRLPRHVAIIMDGNRRFARQRGLPKEIGHVFGSKKAEEVINWCWEVGIKMLTLYAFSTENFKRSEEEKRNIFSLIERELRRLMNDRRTYENEVRVRIVGRREMLPAKLVEVIEEVERRTKEHSRFFLNVAVAYGGRQEIVDAARRILRKVREGKLRPDEIEEEIVERHMYCDGDYLKVDLVIRTGGEQRLSNFLPWQSAKSVAYFCDVYWPAFRKIDFLRAIRAWQLRTAELL
ncbi:MAG: polyprenyl diphosphate synthase [Archaeoglobaceae archaeon]